MSKKQQKMSLKDFMADETLGSWADDVADLPTAPAMEYRPSTSNNNSNFDRQGKVESKTFSIPTSPPFVLFVGNLDFEVSDRDLQMFLGDQIRIKSIRIMTGLDGKPRGYGYVEVDDAQSMTDALKLNGQSLRNRSVKLDVSEQSSKRRTDASKSGASNWRRDGPPPPSASQRDGRDSRDSEKRFTRDNTSNDWRSTARPESGRMARDAPRESNQRESHQRERIPRDRQEPVRQELETDWRSSARPQTAIEKPFSRDNRSRDGRDRGDSRDTRDARNTREPKVTEADKVDSWRSQKTSTDWETSSITSRQSNQQYNHKKGKRPFTANPNANPSNEQDSWRRTTDVPLVRPGSARPTRPHVNYSNTKFDSVDSDGFSPSPSSHANHASNNNKSNGVQQKPSDQGQKQVKMGNAFDVLSLE